MSLPVGPCHLQGKQRSRHAGKLRRERDRFFPEGAQEVAATNEEKDNQPVADGGGASYDARRPTAAGIARRV
jgi:hypothetical protein